MLVVISGIFNQASGEVPLEMRLPTGLANAAEVRSAFTGLDIVRSLAHVLWSALGVKLRCNRFGGISFECLKFDRP